MDFIIADCDGNEVGILEERQYIDIDIGNNNDFEIHVSRSFYHSSGIREGYRICVVGQEYGGIIDKIKSVSEEQEIILSGRTWRGLLTQKIIIPPEEQDYKIAYGDAHQIINEIVCNSFEGLFKLSLIHI